MKTWCFKICAAAMVALGLMLADAPEAAAQQLVYRPINPAFGGNPGNYSWLLSSAQAQQRRDDTDRFARDPLSDFSDGLQRQVLSALSRELVVNRFGSQLDLTREGRFDLGDFIIDVQPGLTGVDIRVTNVLTGDETVVTIPNF